MPAGPTTRTPPIGVRRELRKEVGFGCPVPGCASPYLEWHHFDPPWAERQHHDPAGIISLCRDHHKDADGGAFTVDQLRHMKQANGNEAVGASFLWRRHELLIVAGTNFFLRVTQPLVVDDDPIIWFDRDADGLILVNLRHPTTHRLLMDHNDWMAEVDKADDIECPPHGRRVAIRFKNGDHMSVEFKNYDDLEGLGKDYPTPRHLERSNVEAATEFGLQLPLTVVELQLSLYDRSIIFNKDALVIEGKPRAILRHSWVADFRRGVVYSTVTSGSVVGQFGTGAGEP